MRKDIKKNLAELALLGAALGLYAALMHLSGIGCPIKYLTGISCAGCGMTRAWLALLRLDLGAAWSYHPLFWLPPLAVLLWLFREKIPGRLQKVLLCAALLLFVVVWLLRMANPADRVVVWDPQAGLIAGLLAKICA